MTPPLPPLRRRNFLGNLGRGLNITRLVIINLVFFGFLFMLLAVVVASFDGGHEVEPDTVLVLKPQGQLVEQYSVAPLQRALSGLSGEDLKQVQLRDLVGAIDAAARDKRISRILLLPGDLQSGGFAALREVGAALDRFRATGKPVIAWGVNLDPGQ